MTVADVTATMEGPLVALLVKKITENMDAPIASSYFFLAFSFAARALRFARSALSFSISTRV
jgi:hypothetical protein